MRLIMLDNIAAQYWVDKARRASRSVNPGQGPSVLTLHAVHAALAAELRQVPELLAQLQDLLLSLTWSPALPCMCWQLAG